MLITAKRKEVVAVTEIAIWIWTSTALEQIVFIKLKGEENPFRIR